MYLSMLREEHKTVFLELAYELAFLDNDFSEKERIMIESYCNEMRVEVPTIIRARTINEIVESMKSDWEDREKKMVVFEIIGLAMVDGNYDNVEKKAVEDIAAVLQIEESFVEQSEVLLNEYLEMQNKINRLVLS